MTSTLRILALKALERPCGQECVDWAIDLLERGFDSRNIEILAGVAGPYNHFEIADLRDRVLNDLGVPRLSRQEAVAAYAAELAAGALAENSNIFLSIRELADLCAAEAYLPALYNCYLLYNAWEDLRERGIQWYWHGATLANVEELARAELVALAVSGA